MAIPDVIEDTVTDTAHKLGYMFTEQVFYHAALRAGYGQKAEDKARELDTLWKRQGYQHLPQWIRDFCLAVLNGERL